MKQQQKKEARSLRQNGFSLKHIADKIGVAKSSVSLWVRDISLTQDQLFKLNKRNYEIPNCKRCGKRCNRIKNIYCSFECFLKHTNKKSYYYSECSCKNCGKNTSRYSNFCSSDCKVQFDWKYKINKATESGYAPAHQLTAKALILKMRGRKCEICQETQWQNKPIPVILDHINGCSNDWSLNNLRIVCGNCDMQLPTYKSKNKGKGRSYDRLYRRLQKIELL